MKIYTRTGDTGETTLLGGGRVSKDHPRVVACGSIDELNAFLGRARPMLASESSRDRLATIQRDLFTLGAHMATIGEAAAAKLPGLPEGRPLEMEGWMDAADEELEPLTAFILPGGTDGAAELHLCRTVCRRAERAVLAVPGATFALQYLNRLSDLLFTLARVENRLAGVDDIPWNEAGR